DGGGQAGPSGNPDSTLPSDPLPLALHEVMPRVGPKAGGITVTIVGTGFQGGTAVFFGDTAATEVVVLSGTRITAKLPTWLGEWSYVPVMLRTPDAQAVTKSDLFMYYGSQPAFTPSQHKVGDSIALSAVGDFNNDLRTDLVIWEYIYPLAPFKVL